MSILHAMEGVCFQNVIICYTGEYEKGVDHLTNAIAVCGQPQQLLQVLQQTLPPPVFQMLLTKLPTISQVCETLHVAEVGR